MLFLGTKSAEQRARQRETCDLQTCDYVNGLVNPQHFEKMLGGEDSVIRIRELNKKRTSLKNQLVL